jgi:tRNA pseudouridine38-40 synthase
VTPADDEPALPAGSGGLRRLRLDLGYDGTDFSGWARQPGRRTVEGVLAEAIATALRSPATPTIVVAGRTDAGVHATGQVAHVDLPEGVDLSRLAARLRGLLAADVVVHAVSVAPTGFDARFSALARAYRYRVTDAPPDPLRRRDTLAWRRSLDSAAMHVAAQELLGEHDFAAYCRPRPGGTTIRTLHRLDVTRRTSTGIVTVDAQADAFCHNQVRAMVGALLAVGDGRRAVDWPGQVLRAGVRDSAVTVAPPHGLTLLRVDYPPDDQLAARADTARNLRSVQDQGK